MSLREQLQTIYNAHRALTPALVVEVARDKAHPLHDRFEWDNKAAGEKYRQVQAADLIRSVRIKYVRADGDEEHDVRAFHPITRAEQTTYVPIEELAGDPIGREILLRQAEREWRAMRRRYGHLREFFDLVRRDVDDAA